MQRNDTLTMADYGRAVRRSTWTLALGAVAGALLLAVAGSASSNGFVQKVALRRTSGDAIASSLGLPSTLSLSWSPTSEVQRRLPVIEQTAPGARAEGDLTFVPDESNGVLTISGRGSSEAAATELATKVAAALANARRDEVSAAIDLLRQTTQAQLTTLQKQVADADSDAVARTVALSSLNEASRALLAIDRLATQGGGVSDPEPVGTITESAQSGSATYAILGAILGAAVAAGALVVRRAFDNRVIGRSDLDAAAPGTPVITTVSLKASNHDDAFVRVAAEVMKGRAGAELGSVQLVSLSDGPTDAAWAAIRLADGLAHLGVVATVVNVDAVAAQHPADVAAPTADGTLKVLAVEQPLDRAGDGLVLASHAGATVLLVAARRTNQTQLADDVASVRRVGAELTGLILIEK